MARVQYGSIVTELKGKIQGHVFQGGNVGFVLRNKGYTAGQSTVLRQTANNKLISNTTAWKSLTDMERATWNSGTANWPFVNKFGATYYGSGFQVFNSFNTNRLSLGLSRINSMPSSQTPVDPGTVTFFLDDDGDAQVSWVNTSAANDYVAIFASYVVSAGRNINNPRLRRLGSVNVSGATDSGSIPYGVDGTPFPTPVIGNTVIMKAIFYDGRFPYPYFVNVQKVVVVAH